MQLAKTDIEIATFARQKSDIEIDFWSHHQVVEFLELTLESGSRSEIELKDEQMAQITDLQDKYAQS